ncbi:uncharacterized protein ACIBXB_022367 isoform 2-T3 [Morphnus guianensis]
MPRTTAWGAGQGGAVPRGQCEGAVCQASAGSPEPQSVPDGAGSNAPAGSSCGGGAAPGCGQTLPEEAPAPPCCSGVRHFRFDTWNIKAKLAVVTCLGALLCALFSLAFPGGTPGIGLAVPGRSRPFLGFARLLPKPQQSKSDGGEIWEVVEEQIRPVPPGHLCGEERSKS